MTAIDNSEKECVAHGLRVLLAECDGSLPVGRVLDEVGLDVEDGECSLETVARLADLVAPPTCHPVWSDGLAACARCGVIWLRGVDAYCPGCGAEVVHDG